MAIEIKVGDTIVYTISDLELTFLKSYINEDTLQTQIENWVMCLIRDNCKMRGEQFKNEWIKKLQADETVLSVPVANQAFVDLVLAREDYQTEKEKEESLI